MKIFIDFDDTLYATNAEDIRHVAGLLVSYLEAPLFDGAKEAIESFYKNGNDCWGLTARGSICKDEIPITKSRLRKDGFLNGKNSLLLGMGAPCPNKFSGIRYVHDNYYKQEIQSKDCILIDDCLDAMLDAADHEIQCILFAPKKEEFDAETQEVLNRLKIKVAHSWQEIKSFVESKCQENGNGGKEIAEQRTSSKFTDGRTK